MKNIILIVCLFVCSQIVNAQVNVKFNPIGEKLKDIGKYKKLPSFIPPAKILPKFNLDSILYEDTKRMDLGLPFRYGYEFNVQYSPFNSGKWDVKDSMAIWKLRVKSNNAFSLSFHFNRFYLPGKANLIIYNEEESFLYGPLTSDQNNEKKQIYYRPCSGRKRNTRVSGSGKVEGQDTDRNW